MAAAGRYRLPTEEEMSNLVKEMDSKNTKRVVDGAVESFRNFLTATGRSQDFESLDTATLNSRLGEFYAGVQKGDGTSLKRSSMNCLKYGLKKHILKEMGVDISKQEFTSSSDLFKAVSINLKRRGYGKVDHYPPIAEQDLKSLYSGKTPVFYISSPCGLQNKVWFEIMYYLCRRGRENSRQMTKDTFRIGTDDSGKRFVYQFIDEMDKNHRENNTAGVTEGRMYEIVGDHNCPVLSFQFYISKLHPGCSALWQKPRDSINLGDAVWFCNSPLGKNSLSTMMSKISNIGKLSTTYTNHSVRATSITVMDQSGVDSRHIMKVSGHASETSLKSYSHTINDSKKRQISSILSNSLQGGSSSCPKTQRLCIPETAVSNCPSASSPVRSDSSSSVQETVTTASTQSSVAANADYNDLTSEILNIFEQPFELVEALPQPVTQAHLLETTNIHHNTLNIPATNERNNRGIISFTPKFDANCHVTINFNNYYK